MIHKKILNKVCNLLIILDLGFAVIANPILIINYITKNNYSFNTGVFIFVIWAFIIIFIGFIIGIIGNLTADYIGGENEQTKTE